MRKDCSQCGRKVYVLRSGRAGGRGQLADHDLCDRCHRALRNQIVAQRRGTKPWWAVQLNNVFSHNPWR